MTQTHNPFHALVAGYAALVTEKRHAGQPQQAAAPHAENTPANGARKALVFSPHPDDECIIGALPLRLMREVGTEVVNVAVTLGSNKSRQTERWVELCEACDYLGFTLVAGASASAGTKSLDPINPSARAKQPAHWAGAVEAIAALIAAQQPDIVFFPHADDWNRTHIGTHYLLLDALARMPANFECEVIETEFWGAMATPNMMVESSNADVANLVAALALHRGEVARNPYHLRLPAWMIDNVRRGAELIRGQGEAAPGFAFATLYRHGRWADGRLQVATDVARIIAQGDGLGALLAA